MRTIRQVDADTGEVLDAGMLVYVPQRARLKGGWFMASQEGLAKLAKHDLSHRELRVLLLLMSKLDFENFIHVSQAEVAKELSLDAGNVSKCVKRLIEVGIIIKGPKVGRASTYRLSPDFGWKGRVRNLEQYRKDQLRVVQGSKGSVAQDPSTAE
jgi:hypothetical protein